MAFDVKLFGEHLPIAIKAVQEALKDCPDTGSVNCDACAVTFPRKPSAKAQAALETVLQQFREITWHWSSSRILGHRLLIRLRTGGQAQRSYLAAKTLCTSLQSMGWAAEVHYQTD